MSGRHGEVTLPLGDGDYTFRLPYAQQRALQNECDAGCAWVAARLKTEQWRIEDVRETIRLGLIGAGMAQSEALVIVRKFVEPHLNDCRIIAWTIIAASLVGDKDEPELGKAAGADGKKARRSREAKSPSPGSSASPQPSASHQASSTP